MDKMKEFVQSMTEDKILPSKRLFVLLEKQSAFMEKHRNIFLAIRQNVKSHKEKYLNILDKKLGEFVETITNIINDGIKQGEFKNYPASSVALLFLSLMFANMHRKMNIHTKIVDVYVSPKLLWDIFSKGISK